MTTTETPPARAPKRGRALLAVSLVAILILGIVGATLLLFTGGSNGNDADGEPVPATEPAADAETFTDPQGSYTLDIDPRWTPTQSAGGEEVESWFTGSGTTAFRDNVNVVTQPVGDVDLDQYLQLVSDQAPESVEDYALREFRMVTKDTEPATDTPPQLGVVAYEGRRADQTIGFFLVASVENGVAVVATLTTDKERFDEVRAEVEPYLLTLKQTS